MVRSLNLVYIRHNRYELCPKISARRIPYCDLTLLLDGTLFYRIDGEEIELHAGDLIFIRKGERRERQKGREKTDYISFNFESEEHDALPRVIRKGVSRDIQHLVAACDEVGRMPRVDNERRLGYLLECILLLLREKTTTTYSPLTEGILQYLHTHMAERITLADVGKQMHFSPVYCDTVFKREIGSSIVSYLLDVRMEEAKKRLLEDVESVRQIARSVGFEDHNYFSRAFKKRVGYTPTRYRNSIIKNLLTSDQHEKGKEA